MERRSPLVLNQTKSNEIEQLIQTDLYDRSSEQLKLQTSAPILFVNVSYSYRWWRTIVEFSSQPFEAKRRRVHRDCEEENTKPVWPWSNDVQKKFVPRLNFDGDRKRARDGGGGIVSRKEEKLRKKGRKILVCCCRDTRQLLP